MRLRAFFFGTLRGRLILSVATVHAVLMTLFIVNTTLGQRALFLSSQTDEAASLCGSLAANSAIWLAADDISGLQELIETDRRYPNVLFAMLTDEDGRILAHTDKSKRGLYLLDLPKERRETVVARTTALVDVISPVQLSGQLVGWARVGVAQKKAHAKLRQLTMTGILYALVAIVLGSLIAWIMGRRATRRLYAVQDTISRIRGGDRTARAAIGGTDEAASIAREFNAMLNMLDGRNRALLKSEQQYRSLLNNIDVAVVVHGPDTRVLIANPTAQRLLRLSEDEMISRSSVGTWLLLREDGSPMPLEEYPVNRAIQLHRPIRNVIIGHRPSDQAEPAWLLINATPLLSPSENATHDIVSEIIVTFIDITERKRAEEDLKRLTMKTEMILNSAGEGIYGTDIHGNILFMNSAAEAMLGYTTSEVLGQSSHALFHHSRANGQPYPFEECPLHITLVHGESHRGLNEVFWTKDGRMFPIEHVNTPLLENGAVIGAVIVFRDIAEQKQAENKIKKLTETLEEKVRTRTADLQRKSDELRDSQMALMNIVEDLNLQSAALAMANEKLKGLDRLKSMFIVSMSHELRTPLNSIIGFSSILVNEWAGKVNPEQKENLTAILRSGRHLLALINDVIDVTKIEAGRLQSIPEDVDISSTIVEAVSNIEKDVQNKGLFLNINVEHRTIRTDRRRLLQCLLNLLSNAAKFTQQGGITVSTRFNQKTKYLDIAIADTGIGIRKEDMERLFQPFVRLESPLKSTVLGTGLGLYLTKKLATEVLCGDALVSSIFGKGSTFILRLPGGIYEESARNRGQ